MSFQSRTAGDIQTISKEPPYEKTVVTNGNLILHIPILDYPQRGRLDAKLLITYNGKGWQAFMHCAGTSCTSNWSPIHVAYVQVQSEEGALATTFQQVTIGSTTKKLYTAITDDGGTHQLAARVSGGYESIDGTGIYYNGSSVLIDHNGSGFQSASNVNWQDTNGNYLNSYLPVSGYTPTPHIDTLGRSLVGTSVNDGSGNAGCATGTGFLSVTSTTETAYLGPNGTQRVIKTCSVTFNVKTAFNAVDYDPNGNPHSIKEWSGSYNAIQSIILYNGVSWAASPQWSFQYAPNSDGTNYGDLTQVTLPTGGTISYTWGTTALCGNQPITPVSRRVLSRTVNANDGKGNETTTYNGGLVTDPAGNDTNHVVTGLNGSCSLYETATYYYSGTGSSRTLLKTVTTAYSSTSNPFDQYGDGTTTRANVEPSSVTTSWPIPGTSNSLVSQIQTDYDQSFSFAAWPGQSNPVSGGSYGLLKEKREYGYGVNSAGPLSRKTDYTYLALSNSNYLNSNIITPVSQVTVYDGSGNKVSQTTNTYDGASLQSSGITMEHNSVGSYRGNLTMVQKWLNTTGGTVTTAQTSYYDTGMPYQSLDLNSNATTYTYGSAYYGAYLTQTQYPNTGVAHTIQGAYDFNTGLLTGFTDQNSQTSSYGYDVVGRMTSASFPDNGSTTFQYTDTIPVQIKRTVAITSSLNKITNSVFDGLGRISEFQLQDPDCTVGSGLVKTDYSYGYDTTQNTRYTTVSSPYCDTPGSTFGLPTRTDSDALGRTLKITEADGSVATTSFAANSTLLAECATAKDEAGKSHMSCADGLGRMTSVWEDPAGLNYETDYGYDLLNDLTSVNQKGDNSAPRTRAFTYDSLARLTGATNPESGAISYSYSNSSGGCAGDPAAICTRTAPAPNQTGAGTVTTTYSYDILNRLTQKSYSDGSTPTAELLYDTTSTWACCTQSNIVGRLSRAQVVSGSQVEAGEIFSYDPLGRIILNNQCTPSNCGQGSFSVNYSYDLAGDLTSASNGQGVSISYTLDTIGRPTNVASSLVDSQHPATLAAINSSSGYYPNGSLHKLTFGNGLTETRALNTRLQPCRVDLNSSGTALGTCGDSIPSGTVQDFNYGFNSGTTDNGDIVSMVGAGNQVFNRTYGYDALNRLSTMVDSASNQGCKGLNETYDPWGNRTNQSVTSGSCFTFSAAATSHNQLSGYSYDAAGNLTGDGNHTYAYDAEDRIVSVDGGSTASYVYDAKGHRVRKTVSAGWYDYIRDLGGQVVAEVNTSGWQVGYVYLRASFLAQYSNGTTYFVLPDHLGSTRLLTDMSGGVFDSMDYQPFGEQIAGNTGSFLKFTGKERDFESGAGFNGLDYFGARYSSSTLGRFMTPDQKLVTAKLLINPQDLNLYSYTVNNPIKYVDPNGLDWQKAWDDLKEAGASLYAKITVGIGVGGEVKAGPAKGKLDLSYKVNATIATKGEVTTSHGFDAGVTAGPEGKRVGLGVSGEQKLSTVGVTNSGPEPWHVEATVLGETKEAGSPSLSKDQVGIGFQQGEGVFAGAELGITKDGLAALGDALKNVKDEIIPPSPPAPCHRLLHLAAQTSVGATTRAREIRQAILTKEQKLINVR